MEAALDGECRGDSRVVTALKQSAVGNVIDRKQTAGLDNVKGLGRVLEGISERGGGTREIELLVLAERAGSRDVTCPKEDGVHEYRMALFGSGEGEGVPETTDVDIKTTLVAVGDEDLEAIKRVRMRSVSDWRGGTREEYSQNVIERRGLHTAE